jgi:hypothetical protein
MEITVNATARTKLSAASNAPATPQPCSSSSTSFDCSSLPRLAPSPGPVVRTPVVDPSDPQLLAQLDELVLRATQGDRRAIGAIARTFTEKLRAEANAMLRNEHDAEDVVQDFFLALLEGRMERFPPGQGRGLSFMLGVVRATARKRRRERRRP